MWSPPPPASAELPPEIPVRGSVTALSQLDPRLLRKAYADQIRTAEDIELPTLEFWNNKSCRFHETPRPDCEYRLCGGELYAHQRVGVSWLYLRERGILSDVMGAGKTNQIYGLLALLKQRDELGGRALVVCQTPASVQWLEEGHRWVPQMHIEAALSKMPRLERIKRYAQNWEVLIVGYHLALKDARMLAKLAPDILVVDDVDPILDHSNKTHKVLEELSRTARRSIVINATTIQMRLQQIHAASMLTDGQDVFGSLGKFERRHIRQDPVTIYNVASGKKTTQLRTTGFKNMTELRDKLTPMVLRRKYEDLKDLKMPALMPPQDVWLELYPAQRKKYQELQASVEILINSPEGAQMKQVTALTRVGYGQRICAGLAALGEEDGPGASVKLDWLVTQLQTQWADQKVVVFIQNLATVAALEARLQNLGIGSAKIWGRDSSAKYRTEEITRFWNDPKCRVMMGTAAIERSLNLQCANIMVFVDLFLNPARVAQTVGRIRRIGSQFERVFVFNLLTVDTQEERYKAVLNTRQALSDWVFEDTSELFEQLSTQQLLELILP